jgi:predicted site-specific integrase-resolvase
MEPRMPMTQKRRLVPYHGTHRDKESLVKEMELLMNAFEDQTYHFRSHKMHHEAVEAVNRFEWIKVGSN